MSLLPRKHRAAQQQGVKVASPSSYGAEGDQEVLGRVRLLQADRPGGIGRVPWPDDGGHGVLARANRHVLCCRDMPTREGPRA